MTPLPDPAARAVLSTAGVDAPLAERLAVYAALVLEANRRVNLTGAKTGDTFAAHIVDALTLAPYIVGPLVDVGSGNGLPGFPLALATGVPLTVVEPIAKRTAFLERAAEALGLSVTVVTARAEEAARLPELREAFGSATARAVAGATTVAELTVPFLRMGGRAVLQRGETDDGERHALTDAALVLGAEVEAEIPLEGERRIFLVRKTGPTSPRFPRRNGIPGKRPLCLR